MRLAELAHAWRVKIVDEIAEAVHVDPGDVQVIVQWLAADDLDISSPDTVTAVHRILNPNAERTVPGLYFPDDEAGTGRTRMR